MIMGISEFDFQMMLSRVSKKAVAVPRVRTCAKPVEEESELRNQLHDLCRARGWGYIAARSDQPSTIGKGVHDDTIFADHGRMFLFELKDREGKLSKDQNNWIALLRHNGHTVHVVRSIEEVLDIIDQRKLPVEGAT